jgi:hypothetical protein
VSVLTRSRRRTAHERIPLDPGADFEPGGVPIAQLVWRRRTRVAGRVRSIRVQPWGGVPTLECTLVDESGGLIVVFLGRRAVAGIGPGRRMVVEGMVGSRHGLLAMINPEYQLLAASAE